MSIVKIVLNINGVDTPISFDDAKKLYQDLQVIFGDKPLFVPKPMYDPGYPNHYPDYGKISWSSSPSC